MGRLLLAVLLVSTSVQAIEPGALHLSESESNKVLGADVQLTHDARLVARAASFHKVTQSEFQIRESDNCDWRKVSDTQIQIGRRCDYLSGGFTYVFQPEGQTSLRRIFVGFTASRPSSEGKIFMVSAPLEVVEK